jgi:hypothetical protein
MSATTVKLEGAVLSELRRIKPANKTLAALVRELLEAELRRQRMTRAAADYSAFLSKHPEEAEEMDAWATARLELDVTKRRPRTKR